MNTIYIGASNKKYGLQQNTIYKERPTNLIEALKPELPLIERLFVSVLEFAEKEKELSRPETLIHRANLEIGNRD